MDPLIYTPHYPMCSMYEHTYLHEWLKFMVNVGKYSSPMEHLGMMVWAWDIPLKYRSFFCSEWYRVHPSSEAWSFGRIIFQSKMKHCGFW